MTRFLLDANVFSDLVRNPQGRVAARIAEAGDAAIRTSILVTAELRFEAAQKGSARLTFQLESILSAIDIPPFEAPADAAYSRLRVELEAAGAPIGVNDMLTAAHALGAECTLATDNERAFARLKGLPVENWLR